MKKYPLKLSYTAKTALWAGKRLKEEFGKQSEHDTVSETWELSVRENEMSYILNGEAKGISLREYFERTGYSCVSPSFTREERFPLLVKLIDAADVLSVQVHPDDAYAAEVENDSGKTEMWYIVDACEGAELVYGLKDGITREDFARAVREKRISDVIKKVPVKKGEAYFIPSGMLHAIGAGILIAEIQQNSDLTYRVYDFDRVGKDGKLRPLHVEKALDVTRPYSADEINAVCYSRGTECEEGKLLAASEYFKVRYLKIDGNAELAASEQSFVSLLCVGGEGCMEFGGETYPLNKGDSYFLPAGMGDFCVCGDAELIISEL